LQPAKWATAYSSPGDYPGFRYRTLRELYPHAGARYLGLRFAPPQALCYRRAPRAKDNQTYEQLDQTFFKVYRTLIDHFLLNLFTRFTNDFQSCLDVGARGAEVGDARTQSKLAIKCGV